MHNISLSYYTLFFSKIWRQKSWLMLAYKSGEKFGETTKKNQMCTGENVESSFIFQFLHQSHTSTVNNICIRSINLNVNDDEK